MKLKSIDQIRNKLGIQQKDMAFYLSVSTSLLASYETNRRDLPIAAIQKLGEIERFIYNHKAKKKSLRPHIKLQQAKAQSLFDVQVNYLAYKQVFARRKLTAMQNLYDKRMLLLDLVDHIRANKQIADTKNRLGTWLNFMEVLAMEDIEKNGLDKQAMLQVKINSMRYQQEQVMQLKQVPVTR